MRAPSLAARLVYLRLPSSLLCSVACVCFENCNATLVQSSLVAGIVCSTYNCGSANTHENLCDHYECMLFLFMTTNTSRIRIMVQKVGNQLFVFKINI